MQTLLVLLYHSGNYVYHPALISNILPYFHGMYVFRVILTINGDYLPVLHWAVGIYNRELFLWRRNWILKCCSDEILVNVIQWRAGQDASNNTDGPLVGHFGQGFLDIPRSQSKMMTWCSLTSKCISYWLPYRSKLHNPSHDSFLTQTINN
jgi:hypothetical protein